MKIKLLIKKYSIISAFFIVLGESNSSDITNFSMEQEFLVLPPVSHMLQGQKKDFISIKLSLVKSMHLVMFNLKNRRKI